MNKKEWLAILCTDLSLPVEEFIRIYGIRWDIEVFFKCTKSLFRLQKEFQGRSYDLMVSHTTIVFSRYILFAWQHRQCTDNRTLGGLFHLLCDEIGQIDWAIALKQLIEILETVAKEASKKITTLPEIFEVRLKPFHKRRNIFSNAIIFIPAFVFWIILQNSLGKDFVYFLKTLMK